MQHAAKPSLAQTANGISATQHLSSTSPMSDRLLDNGVAVPIGSKRNELIDLAGVRDKELGSDPLKIVPVAIVVLSRERQRGS
jgi:hypothetical protein